MVKIENKQIELEKANMPENPPKDPITYVELMKQILRFKGEKGFDYEEMRKRFRILDVLDTDEPKHFIELEDSDFEYFKKCMEQFKWSFMDRSFFDFMHYMKNLKPQSAN